ncbi:MAG: hypothetical protein M0029_10755 [Actinomycetota bacterium]|nr:hypothetical protein [Actinomycetota bacterium]
MVTTRGDERPPGRAAASPRAGRHVEGCDLCEAAHLTAWHAEDEVCWVADCEACDVPIVVWRHHGADPPVADVRHMIAVLGAVADERFGHGAWKLDRVMRQIPDHFHAHARDEGWWSRRMGARP